MRQPMDPSEPKVNIVLKKDQSRPNPPTATLVVREYPIRSRGRAVALPAPGDVRTKD